MRATSDAGARAVVRVRPKFSLLSNGFSAVVLATAPPYGVAYWFAARHGEAGLVLLAGAGILVIGGLLLWRQLRIYSEVTETELRGNGIFTPLVRVPLADIREVLLVPTYLGAAPEPVLQLLVTDARGRRVYRSRGNFWHEADLITLAAALPVRYELVSEPMSLRDFFRTYPGSAYWFEARRSIQVTLVAALAVLGFIAMTLVMLALGLPVRFIG